MSDCDHRLPFGRHQNKPLAEVPGDYLAWALSAVKLSSGLRQALADELRSRGLTPPPQPPPRPVLPCRDCGAGAPVSFAWAEDKLGRRFIRASCARCKRTVDHPPTVPPYSDMADAAASGTGAGLT
jgi:hypothetical protein